MSVPPSPPSRTILEGISLLNFMFLPKNPPKNFGFGWTLLVGFDSAHGAISLKRFLFYPFELSAKPGRKSAFLALWAAWMIL